MSRDPGSRIIIRLASDQDIASVTSLHGACAAEAEMNLSRHPFLFSNDGADSTSVMRERILDGCMLVARSRCRIVAAAGIDLDGGSLSEFMIADEADAGKLFEPLVAAAERRAVRFGISRLGLRARKPDAAWFVSLGFTPEDRLPEMDPPDSARQQFSLQRSLKRRQTAYGRRVLTLNRDLGVPSGYGRRHRLPLQPETCSLASIGEDIYGREQKLGPRAAAAWLRLQQAASADGIELQAVSAWRSVSYQAELLRRKLEKGIGMEEILTVSAPPGFSEHHTGRAIDVTTPGAPVLEEAFENSAAFLWLVNHAADYSFRLSFPRGNRHQLAYEPWHWCFEG